MKLHQKINSQRYCVFAKRVGGKDWTNWTQVNNKKVAMAYLENIRSLGFLGKVTDRKKRKVIVSD